MEEYLLLILNKLAMVGFLETRAVMYTDIIISFLALLPLLSGVSIFFAIQRFLKLHQVTQFLLFFVTLIILLLFAYTVHYKEGFEILLKSSSIDRLIIVILLVIHTIISLVTLYFWFFTLIYAVSDRKRRALPGMYSRTHKEAGKRVFQGIFLIALTSTSIYWVLYME